MSSESIHHRPGRVKYLAILSTVQNGHPMATVHCAHRLWRILLIPTYRHCEQLARSSCLHERVAIVQR